LRIGRLFLSGFGNGLVVGLGERANVALLTALLPGLVSLSVEAPGTWFSTDLPLGETKVHHAAALSSETGLVLQGPAHGAGGNRQVAVVARAVSENQLLKMLFPGVTYVRPAAFQAAVILNGVEGGSGSIEGGENGFRVSLEAFDFGGSGVVITCIELSRECIYVIT
jgi:hypothetical protein